MDTEYFEGATHILTTGPEWDGSDSLKGIEIYAEYDAVRGCFFDRSDLYLKSKPSSWVVKKKLSDKSPKSSYHITVNGVAMDYYDYCDALNKGKAYQAGDSAIEHARKKLTDPGGRSGKKSRYDDVKEARNSLTRALEQMEADNVD